VGLKTKYDTDLDFEHTLKMILALAFVPEEKVLEYFNELIERQFNTENEKLDE
jgi:hypothetical protein